MEEFVELGGDLVIRRDDIMALFVNACPSFQEKWEGHLQDIWDRNSESILYTDLAEFARHLTELVIHNKLSELANVFGLVEKLLFEGDPFVQEAVVVGLIEDFQGGLERNGYDLKTFEKFLEPETQKYWTKVIKFWNGEIPYIDNN